MFSRSTLSVHQAADYPTEITPCTMTLASVQNSVSCTVCNVFTRSMKCFTRSMKCHSEAGNWLKYFTMSKWPLLPHLFCSLPVTLYRWQVSSRQTGCVTWHVSTCSDLSLTLMYGSMPCLSRTTLIAVIRVKHLWVMHCLLSSVFPQNGLSDPPIFSVSQQSQCSNDCLQGQEVEGFPVSTLQALFCELPTLSRLFSVMEKNIQFKIPAPMVHKTCL